MTKLKTDVWHEAWDRAGSQGLDTWFELPGSSEDGDGECDRTKAPGGDSDGAVECPGA